MKTRSMNPTSSLAESSRVDGLHPFMTICAAVHSAGSLPPRRKASTVRRIVRAFAAPTASIREDRHVRIMPRLRADFPTGGHHRDDARVRHRKNAMARCSISAHGGIVSDSAWRVGEGCTGAPRARDGGVHARDVHPRAPRNAGAGRAGGLLDAPHRDDGVTVRWLPAGYPLKQGDTAGNAELPSVPEGVHPAHNRRTQVRHLAGPPV